MTYGIIGVGAIGAAIVTGLSDGGTNEQFLGVLEQARVFDAVDTGLNQILERLMRR